MLSEGISQSSKPSGFLTLYSKDTVLEQHTWSPSKSSPKKKKSKWAAPANVSEPLPGMMSSSVRVQGREKLALCPGSRTWVSMVEDTPFPPTKSRTFMGPLPVLIKVTL